MSLVDSTAPDFKLEDQDGKTHQLSDYRGQWVVVYFYPKDMTSGCTVEAQSFRDHLDEFKAKNVQVFGVSCDDAKQHQKFANVENLNFPLLADVDQLVVQDYGVWVEKSMYGKKFMGIQRDTFVINPEGVVAKHYEKVKPQDHVEKLLKDLEELV